MSEQAEWTVWAWALDVGIHLLSERVGWKVWEWIEVEDQVKCELWLLINYFFIQ